MKKDIGLALDAAAQAQVPLPLGAKTLALYQQLSTSGFGGKDFSSIYEFLRSHQANEWAMPLETIDAIDARFGAGRLTDSVPMQSEQPAALADA
jgi:hypothetical protein